MFSYKNLIRPIRRSKVKISCGNKMKSLTRGRFLQGAKNNQITIVLKQYFIYSADLTGTLRYIFTISKRSDLRISSVIFAYRDIRASSAHLQQTSAYNEKLKNGVWEFLNTACCITVFYTAPFSF